MNELIVQELQAVLIKFHPHLDLKPFTKKETLKLQVETHFSSLPTKPLWYTSELFYVLNSFSETHYLGRFRAKNECHGNHATLT